MFLEQIRHESTLSESSLFTEYGEMVTQVGAFLISFLCTTKIKAIQFGFVVLWSIIWPLVPVAAFINNFVSSPMVIAHDNLKNCYDTSLNCVPMLSK